MNKLLLSIICIAFPIATIDAENLYRDFLTGFSDMSAYCSESGYIEINNNTGNPIFETQEFNVAGKFFTYQIRMKTNQGKIKHQFLKRKSDDKFGIVWNFINDSNYEAVEINQCESDRYDEIANNKRLKIEAFKLSDGKKQTYFKKEVSDGMSTNGDYNSLRLTYNEDGLKIEGGDRYLLEIAKIQDPEIQAFCKIGYFAGAKTGITIKRIEFSTNDDKRKALITYYTKVGLDSLFAKSTDPNEGYWKYFDRNTDDEQLRLGGKYDIAVVKKQTGGYDILYIGGANVNPQYWQPFMKKGDLQETPFLDQYNATWFDVNKNAISDEAYATFSDNMLSIKLPIHKSEIRFVKLVK